MRLARIGISEEMLVAEGMKRDIFMQMLSLLPADASLHSIWTGHTTMTHWWTFKSNSFKEVPMGEVVPDITPMFCRDASGNVWCDRIEFNGILEEPTSSKSDVYEYKVHIVKTDSPIATEPVTTDIQNTINSGFDCQHVWKMFSVPFSNPVNYCRNCGIKQTQ